MITADRCMQACLGGLARTAPFQGDGGTIRRASLGLMLDLASQAARDPDYAFEGLLRGAAYTGALVDGSMWQVAKPLERVLRGWGTYQRNELLSLAVQGLFAAVLRAIERDEAQSIRQASDAADIAVRLLSSRGADLKLSLDALVARVRGELPALADWQHEDHELQRGWRLQNLPLKDDTNLEEIAQESIAILLAILARGIDTPMGTSNSTRSTSTRARSTYSRCDTHRGPSGRG